MEKYDNMNIKELELELKELLKKRIHAEKRAISKLDDDQASSEYILGGEPQDIVLSRLSKKIEAKTGRKMSGMTYEEIIKEMQG